MEVSIYFVVFILLLTCSVGFVVGYFLAPKIFPRYFLKSSPKVNPVPKPNTFINMDKPSFWAGVGSIFVIDGNYYNYKTDKSIQGDIANDWKVVGLDFKKVLKIS